MADESNESQLLNLILNVVSEVRRELYKQRIHVGVELQELRMAIEDAEANRRKTSGDDSDDWWRHGDTPPEVE